MTRSEKPPYRGARKPDQRGSWNQPRQQGIISDNRQAWVTLADFDAILFIDQNPEERGYDPDTPVIRVELRIPGRRYSTRISLTKMTAPELEEFEKFILHAINKARPICETLDERAKEGFMNGNDGYVRLYRPIPRFIDRERFVSEHRKGLQKRPERLVDGVVPEEGSDDLRGPEDGYNGGSPPGIHEGGIGESGSGLPHEPPGIMVPLDNPTEAGLPEEVRGVDGMAELPGDIQGTEEG